MINIIFCFRCIFFISIDIFLFWIFLVFLSTVKGKSGYLFFLEFKTIRFADFSISKSLVGIILSSLPVNFPSHTLVLYFLDTKLFSLFSTPKSAVSYFLPSNKYPLTLAEAIFFSNLFAIDFLALPTYFLYVLPSPE